MSKVSACSTTSSRWSNPRPLNWKPRTRYQPWPPSNALPAFKAARVSSCDEVRPRSSRGHRSEEHTSELQSRENLVCRLLLEKQKILTKILRSIGYQND